MFKTVEDQDLRKEELASRARAVGNKKLLTVQIAKLSENFRDRVVEFKHGENMLRA